MAKKKAKKKNTAVAKAVKKIAKKTTKVATKSQSTTNKKSTTALVKTVAQTAKKTGQAITNKPAVAKSTPTRAKTAVATQGNSLKRTAGVLASNKLKSAFKTDNKQVKKAIQKSNSLNALGTEKKVRKAKINYSASDVMKNVAENVSYTANKSAKNAGVSYKDVKKPKTLPKYTKSEDLTSEEYLRLQNAERLPGRKAKNAALGKDLAKKVGKRNVYDLQKSAGAIGFMEGTNPLPIELDKMGSGTYTKNDKKVMEKSKDSTAYKVGYGAGQVGSFALTGGGGALEKDIAKGLLKGSTKKAVSGVVKSTAKSTAKNTTKAGVKKLVKGQLDDATKGVVALSAKQAAKTASKGSVKKFVANRAADVILSAPLNATDAIKQATDEKGNVNWTRAIGNMALNTGFDIGVGSAFDAGSAIIKKLTSREYKTAIRLMAKEQSGTITKGEKQTLDNIITKARKKATKSIEDGRNTYYNSTKGGTENAGNTGQVRTEVLSDVSGGRKDIQQADKGISAGKTDNRYGEIGETGKQGLGGLGRNNKILLNEATRNKMTEHGIVDAKLADTDYAVFSAKLDEARAVSKEDLSGLEKQNSEALKKMSDNDIIENTIEYYERADELDKIQDATPTAEAVNPFKDKDISNVGNKSVKSYMYENPEVKPYFKEEARMMLDDLDKSVKGKRIYSDNKFYSQKRYVDDGIADLIDNYGYTYADIEKGLKAIIEGNGAENNAISKRIEFLIDERLRNGYKHFLDGTEIPANNDYLNLLKAKQITEYNEENFSAMLKAKGIDVEPKSKVEISAKKNIEKDKNAEANWKAQSEAAYNNPGKQYSSISEKIKAENPPPKDFLKKALDGVSDEEISIHAPKLADSGYLTTEEIQNEFISAAKEGKFNKARGMSSKEALERAYQQADNDLEGLYKTVMNRNVLEADTYTSAAQRAALMDRLSTMAKNGEDVTDKLINVMEADVQAASQSGRALNAQKLTLRTTPQGRLRILQGEIDRLNKKYADRIDGKIELTEDQIQRIMNAESPEDIAKAMEDINAEIWDNIPATMFEKMNEIRHWSMLFNPKTHIRNILGNTVFKGVRSISDGIEILLNKAVKNKLIKLDSSSEMVHVKMSDIKPHKKYLNDIFDKAYNSAESKNRYIETTRPDGSPVFKNKILNKMVDINYGALEWEDVYPTFRPEFRKNYIRWCKSKDIPLNKIDKMTEAQKEAATRYAMEKAEYATFRDASAMSRLIVGAKEATATKTGNTALGTAGYRAANAAIEGAMPFVKTPVNIFRRAVDYSPFGLIRGTAKLRKASKMADPTMLKEALHDYSTGLTGTGIFSLGAFLASQDLITVKAGNVSGDEYYDRDMGYQDYSLVIGNHSLTIDWLSPVQSSLFMGAAAWENFISNEDRSFRDFADCLFALTGPILDMSFMSGTKDTIEMFIEQAYRSGNGEPDWSGAIYQTLFGSIPQSYLSGFVPQLSNQIAMTLDGKQRDTRSTKEDPVAKSWDSFGKKIINKIPVLRNKVLNPKLDRFGQDKETGNNILIRMMNSFLNPSTVKEIKLTKLDKEIIKIYNHMEDGNDKKFFYYNFTGNPNYELENGKRMTYDEAYKYGKASRRELAAGIERMINSKSYKNMTWDMKYGELNDSYWIGQTLAAQKTYGSKYATKVIFKGSDSEKKAYEKYTRIGGTAKEYVNFFIKKERVLARAHDTDYHTKALVVAKYGSDSIAKAYGIYGEKLDTAKEYFNAGGSIKEYSDAMCSVISTIKKASESVSITNKAVAAAYNDVNNRTYKAMGIDSQAANMGVVLKNNGYTFKTLQAMEMDALVGFDADSNNRLKKAEIIAYIDSLGLPTQELKASVFRYFSTANNPYGNIPDYLGMGGDSSSGGGGGSYSRSGRKSSGKTTTAKTKTTKMPSWEDYVKDYISNIEKAGKVNLRDWDSPIDSAYRTKTRNLAKKLGQS